MYLFLASLKYKYLCSYNHTPQVRVDNPNEAHLYESVPVMPGEALLRDMVLSPDQQYLYLLSQRQVSFVSNGGWYDF